MPTVSVSRDLPARAEAVEALLADREAFMRAGGFAETTVEGDRIHLRQHLGFGRIELDLEVVDDPDAALAYEQRDGVFESMRTTYVVEPDGDGSTITATTEFALGGVVGTVLDHTIVKRRRRQELNAQFDFLETALVAD